MLVEVTVQSLGLDRNTRSPVVILREVEGARVLPIWIGPGEASSIAMRLAEMKFTRPLTHDLLLSLVGGLGGSLQRAQITRVEEGTYFAELVIHRGQECFSVDCRPSDSIALALRAEAPIHVNEALLDHTHVEIVDEATPFDMEEGSSEEREPHGISPEELKEYLRRMNPEDFGRFAP